jgi:hypothetical protein
VTESSFDWPIYLPSPWADEPGVVFHSATDYLRKMLLCECEDIIEMEWEDRTDMGCPRCMMAPYILEIPAVQRMGGGKTTEISDHRATGEDVDEEWPIELAHHEDASRTVTFRNWDDYVRGMIDCHCELFDTSAAMGFEPDAEYVWCWRCASRPYEVDVSRIVLQ